MKKFSLTLLLSLFLILDFSLPGNAAVNPTFVLENEAITVADDYIQTIGPNFAPEWENGLAKNPVIYYDSNGNPNVYVVSVEKNNQEIGYVVVSANQNLYPVLEASQSPPPHRQLEQALTEAQKTLKTGEIIGQPKLIYSGMLWFTTEIPILRDGKQIDTLYYHLKAKKMLLLLMIGEEL